MEVNPLPPSNINNNVSSSSVEEQERERQRDGVREQEGAVRHGDEVDNVCCAKKL